MGKERKSQKKCRETLNSRCRDRYGCVISVSVPVKRLLQPLAHYIGETRLIANFVCFISCFSFFCVCFVSAFQSFVFAQTFCLPKIALFGNHRLYSIWEAIKKKNSANVAQPLQKVGASCGSDRRHELYRSV